jgi:hypothetical protein
MLNGMVGCFPGQQSQNCMARSLTWGAQVHRFNESRFFDCRAAQAARSFYYSEPPHAIRVKRNRDIFDDHTRELVFVDGRTSHLRKE